MAKEDCIFCQIVAGRAEVSKVFENHELLAFLDINPLSVGHTLIIPKEHYENILDIPDQLISDISVLAKTIGRRMIESLGAEGINIMHATGRAAGQSVFHYHVHILPRKRGDRVGFEEWWFSRTLHPTRDELDEVSNRIRL
ncbi:MAG: HIT family protein [Candidatus Thermoplasmatota archaeon]|jgi:histidine triad (HIT) family protein|nr:HIT family protein [Candidatus Thermoplasmatota archaeon]